MCLRFLYSAYWVFRIAMYCSGKSSPNSIDLRINKLEMRYWAKGYSGTIYSDILCMPFTGLSSQWVPVVKPENIKALTTYYS